MKDNDEHIEPYLLHELASASLDADESARVQPHLESCGRCRAELALARTFAETPAESVRGEDPIMGPALARERGRRSRRLTPGRRAVRWTLVAASVALAAVGIQQLSGPSSPTPGRNGVVRSGDGRESWSVRAERSTDGWMLQWSPVTGATSYTVRVMGADGRARWTTQVKSTTFGLRESVLWESMRATDLAPDAETSVWFVRIAAHRDDGSEDLSRPVELP